MVGPQGSAYQEVGPGNVNVIWESQDRNCIESFGDGEAELWRCPSRGSPERVGPDIAHSVAVLMAKPDDQEAQALARMLLDTGSVDQVLLAAKWQAYKGLYSR